MATSLPHTQSPEALLSAFHVDTKSGLSSSQVDENTLQYGKNGTYLPLPTLPILLQAHLADLSLLPHLPLNRLHSPFDPSLSPLAPLQSSRKSPPLLSGNSSSNNSRTNSSSSSSVPPPSLSSSPSSRRETTRRPLMSSPSLSWLS
jgi:hypothetical protein